MQATSARQSVRVIKQRVHNGSFDSPEADLLAIEDPLEIRLVYLRGTQSVEKRLLVTMRTPGKDTELIHGLLYCEGIIAGAEDIEAIHYERDTGQTATRARVHLRPGVEPSDSNRERNFHAHSSCGVCGTTSIGHLAIPNSLRIEAAVRVPADWVHSLPEQMHQHQAAFQQTGGLHAAALFSASGELLASHEDIGRHNALDKSIGARLQASRTGLGDVLCVSGRMSYEILQKAILARIPIIAGVGAPSSLAVALANDFNVTLVGFLRAQSYNIYSCPERLQ
ncbi:formate dehydrogenase subunit FdhD [Coraliomargarita akajimensis DSM 45221]|uniref:Sulfur carrier protein FdhD n=1 Tax=Coraliomargarita akajimensis (strain DSM 45221 / IAM 15411 / JCM 23193 / KCTC 12865 / 04OKA010-24) TaxID=583355 RepID=D5EQE4_CORAD|nr:formate dehydrogenase subunit FdhD [Coraliomargarita akajimensis DSM 45221]